MYISPDSVTTIEFFLGLPGTLYIINCAKPMGEIMLEIAQRGEPQGTLPPSQSQPQEKRQKFKAVVIKRRLRILRKKKRFGGDFAHR